MTIISPPANCVSVEIARLGILSLDQSTEKIGHSTWVRGSLESWGLFEPDWPELYETRTFVRDYLEQFRSESLIPVLVCEDIYYSKNVKTFKTLAILLGHLQSVAYDCGAGFELVTANASLYSLTGIKTSPKNPVPRTERKRLMIEAASKMAGETLQEDVADSIGVGCAFLKRLAQKEQAIPLAI